jgi:hypothetical protein
MSALCCDHCALPAVVVSPGTEAVACELFALSRPVADRCWCLVCAQAAGFPWLVSERGRRVAA